MKAEVTRFHSPDIDDLRGFMPDDARNVGFLLQVMAGPAGTGAAESFDLQVCTPTWLIERLDPGAVRPGRHSILIAEYDWPIVERYVRSVVDAAYADDWRSLALQLDRHLGRWEFAEYKP